MLYTLLAEVPTNIFLRQGLIVNILPFISHIIFITTQQCHHSEKRAIGNIYANEKLCVSKKTVYLKKKKKVRPDLVHSLQSMNSLIAKRMYDILTIVRMINYLLL